MDADYELDAQGLRCPEPLMLLRNKVRDMAAGEVIKILATDPSTSWDFDNFCRFMNHEMLAKTESETGYQYWIKKG
ncbi:MAG: sulfurtransferase TusA [Pseudomonadales bacterium]|jgi:tRNA 2-thiouridine synthesizing protein A|tara:strand:- start:839 stop:1066 length:228 start_codon:yes stop_codon:yes gene_type:complete